MTSIINSNPVLKKILKTYTGLTISQKLCYLILAYVISNGIVINNILNISDLIKINIFFVLLFIFLCGFVWMQNYQCE